MNVVKKDDCKQYYPPKHDVTIHAMYLQHQNNGCEAPYWVGCSYYQPGAKAEMCNTPLDKIYVVTEGEMTVELDNGQITKLCAGDSVYIGPDETREVRNDTNDVAKMLVIMPYSQ